MLVGHSYGGWLVRLYASLYPADVVGIVLVEAGADNPLRVTPDGKLVHAADLAAGRPVPAVKTSGPLRESELGSRILGMIQDSIKQTAPHANDPPYDKLPADAQCMRSWCFSQVKFAAANDNPFEAEELAAGSHDSRLEKPFRRSVRKGFFMAPLAFAAIMTATLPALCPGYPRACCPPPSRRPDPSPSRRRAGTYRNVLLRIVF